VQNTTAICILLLTGPHNTLCGPQRCTPPIKWLRTINSISIKIICSWQNLCKRSHYVLPAFSLVVGWVTGSATFCTATSKSSLHSKPMPNNANTIPINRNVQGVKPRYFVSRHLGCNIGIISVGLLTGKFYPLRFGQFNLHPDPFLRRFRISISRVPIQPVAPAIPKIIYGHEEGVR
jgi:hypothetical protein